MRATQPFPVGDALIPQCAEQLAQLAFGVHLRLVRQGRPEAVRAQEWWWRRLRADVLRSADQRDLRRGVELAERGAPGSHGLRPGQELRRRRDFAARHWRPQVGNHHRHGRRAPTRSCGRSRTTTPPARAVAFMTTAGGIAFHGNGDGNFQAYDAKTGNLLWQWQTGAGADAPPSTYMIDGVQYVSIARGRRDRQRCRLATRRHVVDVCAERRQQTAADASAHHTADHRDRLHRRDRPGRNVDAAEQGRGRRLRLHAEPDPDQGRRHDPVCQQRAATAHRYRHRRHRLGHRSARHRCIGIVHLRSAWARTSTRAPRTRTWSARSW